MVVCKKNGTAINKWKSLGSSGRRGVFSKYGHQNYPVAIKCFFYLLWLFWPSDAIWWHRPGSKNVKGILNFFLPCFLLKLSLIQWHHMNMMASQFTGKSTGFFQKLFQINNKDNIKAMVCALLALCIGNPQVTSGFPPQKSSNSEGIFMLWYHHCLKCTMPWPYQTKVCLCSVSEICCWAHFTK